VAEADAALLVHDEVLLVVQINGKVRGKSTVPPGLSEAEAIAAAAADAKVAGYLDGSGAQDVFVPDRLLNVVVG
jgi:leucyl-tRNA synthetase